MTDMTLRPVAPADDPALWDMLRPVFRAGDTYAVDPGIARDAALRYWRAGSHTAFVAEDGTTPLGTYYICPNQQGFGAHVCNCGFVTAAQSAGRGVARAMLNHALDTARASGYRAMQFNFVVETNARAVALWTRAGFDTVGRLPGAFHHPAHGFVDALVMYKTL
ncbi:GNAT family N-acetyltransferase [Roseicitreum antarcticum]|uniref:Ribosomal protein S18 acetylase RimI n=1 Tax=Roseicitreum antarcticum TaxID=564137 RepID=A0A1H2VNU7_9RHOB|nr:GNAT family N-acetyltransferase [Roseicitreum antarcticum]SDW69950.1 Ribosomal protein S18 acetylase RimI [Roseicitreum antarcticum]